MVYAAWLLVLVVSLVPSLSEAQQQQSKDSTANLCEYSSAHEFRPGTQPMVIPCTNGTLTITASGAATDAGGSVKSTVRVRDLRGAMILECELTTAGTGQTVATIPIPAGRELRIFLQSGNAQHTAAMVHLRTQYPTRSNPFCPTGP